MRRRLLDYYRQFEALSPEEDSRRLRARRAEQVSRELARVGDLDLSRIDWHEPPDPELVNAATYALRRSLNRYPDPGSAPAAQAVADRHGVAVERVAIGHGAGQLIQAALRELAAGGEVVMPWPSWSLLPALAARAGGRPVPVPLAGTAVDFEALAEAVGESTRAVVVCSPNDPTGALVPADDLRRFASALRPDLTVLLDEALVDFAGEEASCASLVDEVTNLLVFRSFSKAWAMAGLRAGYVVGPAGDEDLVRVLSPGQGVSSPGQFAVVAALGDPARAERRLSARRGGLAAERDRLRSLLRDTPFSFADSHAHVVWLRGEGMTASQIAHGLAEQRVHVASGSGWGDDEHVRVTIRDRPATDRLASALRQIARA